MINYPAKFLVEAIRSIVLQEFDGIAKQIVLESSTAKWSDEFKRMKENQRAHIMALSTEVEINQYLLACRGLGLQAWIDSL